MTNLFDWMTGRQIRSTMGGELALRRCDLGRNLSSGCAKPETSRLSRRRSNVTELVTKQRWQFATYSRFRGVICKADDFGRRETCFVQCTFGRFEGVGNLSLDVRMGRLSKIDSHEPTITFRPNRCHKGNVGFCRSQPNCRQSSPPNIPAMRTGE